VWPAFITREVHVQLLAAFEARSQPWVHGRSSGRSYLLTGFVVCGTSMYGQVRQLSTGKTQRRYRCWGKDHHGSRIGCAKVYRDADALEEWVTEAVFARFDSPAVAQALTPVEDDDRAHELSVQLAGYKKRRELLAAEYGLGEQRRNVFGLVVDRVAVHPSRADRFWNGHRFNPEDIVIEWIKASDQEVAAGSQSLVRSAERTLALLAPA